MPAGRGAGHLRGCGWNWQTRGAQTLVGLAPCGFDSRHPHQSRVVQWQDT